MTDDNRIKMDKPTLIRELKKAFVIENKEERSLLVDSALMYFINDEEIYAEFTKVRNKND